MIGMGGIVGSVVEFMGDFNGNDVDWRADSQREQG